MLNKKEIILQCVKKKQRVTSQELAKNFQVSRVYASKLLSELVEEGKLVQIGKTRGSFYVLPKDREKFFQKHFQKSFQTKGLEEDEVFEKFHQTCRSYLKKNIFNILRYAFTEMLNNAIDHSKSPRVIVDMVVDLEEIRFTIGDHGIGIFNNLRKTFRLEDNYEALQHLLKGKQTTDPARHSGQGIFFTSKIADRFEITSSKLHLIIDNSIPDVFVEEITPVKGTRVFFAIRKNSSKDLNTLFDEYTDEDFRFSRTQTIVELYKQDDSYVSRSQAKKLLQNLEGFDTIILDFKKVRLVGQGFADEVFRVYQNQRPEVELIPIHMQPSAEFMINRAKAQYGEEKQEI